MSRKNLESFSKEFKKQINEFLNIYEKYKFHEAKELILKLDIFKFRHIGFRFFYSELNNICACIITNDDKIEIVPTQNIYYSLCIDIFFRKFFTMAILDEDFYLKIKEKLQQLSNLRPMFKLQDRSKLILSGTAIEGTCVLAKIDKTSELIWINGRLNFKDKNFLFPINIPFLYIADINKFTKDNASNLFLEIINLLRYSQERKIEDISKAREDLKYLISEFEKLLLSNPKEKEIEKFIQNNFIILEIALNLENPIFQPELPEAGLKPDLIAFDFLKEEWVILDYKLSKYEKLIVGQEKRERFSSRLEELVSQLEDYVEFFDDSENRQKFKSKYKVEIDKNPSAIGLIGFIKDKEHKKKFNTKRKKRLHYGFEIITYDEILKVLKKRFF